MSTTINRRRRWRPLLEVNQSVALRWSRQRCCRTGQTGAMLALIYHMLLFPVNTKTIRFPWQGLLHVASRDYSHAYRHHPALLHHPPPPHSSSPSLRVSLVGITWSPMKMPNQASIKPSASWTKPSAEPESWFRVICGYLTTGNRGPGGCGAPRSLRVPSAGTRPSQPSR